MAAAISRTAQALDLQPGRSPSSTISILRIRANLVDLYVLGDSPIYYGTDTAIQMLTDDRLADLGRTRLAPLVEASRAGHGYTDERREALAALQRAQRELRNTDGGYWIAETDPDAAHQAITRIVTSTEARWAVLGTDGATNHLEASHPELWPSIANYNQKQLDDLLQRIHDWEHVEDPDGQQRPRAKRHDDKTLAAISRIF